MISSFFEFLADFSNILEFMKITEFFSILFLEPTSNLKKNVSEIRCYELEKQDVEATEDPWIQFREWKIKQKESHVHQVS